MTRVTSAALVAICPRSSATAQSALDKLTAALAPGDNPKWRHGLTAFSSVVKDMTQTETEINDYLARYARTLTRLRFQSRR